jgi:hypothetical protein
MRRLFDVVVMPHCLGIVADKMLGACADTMLLDTVDDGASELA